MKQSGIISQAGFTLIELMVVVAAIIILTGGSIAAYLNFNKTQVMNTDAQNLAAEIRRVKTLAASQQYPTGCGMLESYIISSEVVNDSLTGVRVTANCSPTDVIYEINDLLINSYFSAPFVMNFLPRSGYISNGADQTITLIHDADETYTRNILVGAYGTINIQ